MSFWISLVGRISIVSIALSSGALYTKDKPLTLDSEILKLIDGTPFLNGYEIKIMLHVLLKLQTMLDGEVDATGKKVGGYTFNGQRYSINELIALEASEQELSQDQKSSMTAALQEAKDDFEKKVFPYVGNARGAKQQLFMLIQESCKKHGRSDSFLLTWGEAQEGHEGDAMRTGITTCAQLKLFCNDLTNFLKDMINSCPKAVAHYKELKAHYAAQHKAGMDTGIPHEQQHNG